MVLKDERDENLNKLDLNKLNYILKYLILLFRFFVVILINIF